MFCRRTPPVDRWGKSHYIYGIFISIYQFISIDRISIYQYFISFISMYQYIKFPWSIDIYRLSTILDWPTGPGPTSSCPSMTARCKAVTPLGPLPRGSARAVTRAWPRVDGDVPTGKVKHIIDSMNIIIYTYICINININIYIRKHYGNILDK